MTYANGSVQGLTYDRFGNVIGEKWTNGTTTEAHYRYFYDASNQLVKTVDIGNNKLYNINRVGENVASIEEYDVATITVSNDIYTLSGLSLVGTMHYSFDSDGKQFRKKYVAADGNEQKYVFEYRDEQNVAVQLPTGVVSHSKSDHLGRKVFDEFQLGKGLMNRKFTYHDGVISRAHLNSDKQVSTPETTLVKKIEFADGRTIEYEYDKEERITLVKDSVDGNTAYEYDSLGQLTQEIRNVEIDENGDIKGGTPIEFTYDDYGNILTKNGKVYGYDNSNDNPWKDRLLSYDGQTITYDANGNPTNYLGHTLTWEKGRQLKKFDNIEYTYNANGIRTSKKVNGVLHTYTLDGTNIIKETWNGNTLIPLYDLDGTVCGLKYNGVAYYFYKNLQGDVIAITDDAGAVVARYTYDAWGKITSITGSNIDIAHINPFRYRGYYYDEEIGLYYLQSRYYDASVGRFVNCDIPEILTLAFVSRSVIDLNLFSYCSNTPTNGSDVDGNWWWPTSFSIPSAVVSMAIDAIISWIAGALNATWLGITAPLKTMAKKTALKVFQKTVVPAVKGIIGKILQVAVKALIWIGKTALAASINVGITQTLGILLSVNNGARFLSACFSLGGLIAALVDICTDKKFDGWIKIW